MHSRFRSRKTAKRGGLRFLISHLLHVETFPHHRERIVCPFQRSDPEGLHAKISFRPPSPLWRGIGEPGCNVALLFQPVQSPVKRPNRDRPPGPFLDLPANRHAVAFFPSRSMANNTICSNSPKNSREAI